MEVESAFSERTSDTDVASLGAVSTQPSDNLSSPEEVLPGPLACLGFSLPSPAEVYPNPLGPSLPRPVEIHPAPVGLSLPSPAEVHHVYPADPVESSLPPPAVHPDTVGSSRLSPVEILPGPVGSSLPPPSEVQSDPVGSKRKSTIRRSSIARGRQSVVSLVPPTGKEISKSVPLRYPPDERLAKITVTSVECALLEVSKEMPNLSGMQQFQVEVREKVLRAVKQKHQEGFFKKATQENKCIPNPENLKLDKAIEDCKSHISLLRNEADNWNNLVLRRKEFAVSTLRAKEEQAVIENLPSGISEQYDKRGERPDLKLTVEKLRLLKECYVLAADEVVRKVKYLEKFRTTSEQHLKERNSDLFKYSGMENFASPRKFIEAPVMETQ